MLRTLPNSQKPLSSDTDTSALVAEWKSVCLDHSSDLTNIYTIIKPSLVHWEKILSSGRYIEDINIYTLVNLLSEDVNQGAIILKTWVSETKRTSSILDELTFIFIKRMRKVKYIPRANSDKIIEYVIARDLKLGLKDEILSFWSRYRRENSFNVNEISTDNFVYYDKLPDYYLVDTIKKDYWLYYLCSLIYQGYTSIQRSELTHIKRQNLYREEKELWHLLKSRL